MMTKFTDTGKILLLLVCIFFICAIPASAQNTYTFIGDFKKADTTAQTITIRAENGLLSIGFIDGIGVQVRYVFDNEFGPIHSYAMLDSVLQYEQPEVQRKDDYLILSQNGITVSVQKYPVRLTFSATGDSAFLQESFGAGYWHSKKVHIVRKPKEAIYYGLGEQASSLNRTGRTFVLWNTDAYGYGWDDNPLYSSFPFYIRLHNGKAYGIYYDNSYKTVFDFGGRLMDHVTYSTEGSEIRFYVFYGPEMGRVLKKYTRLTGRSPLPPKWSLGYQQSRWSYYPAEEVYRIAREFRERGIPLDVIYLDIAYMNGYRVFTWDEEGFPHPEKLISDLGEMGVKVVPIVDPGVKVDPGYFVYDQGVKHNYFVTLPNGLNYVGEVWAGPSVFPDFSKPATRSWWGNLYKKLLDAGMDGIWTDMNEPAVFGGKTMPDVAIFVSEGRKTTALEMHNLYGLLMAKATYNGLKELQPNKRPFVITRAAFAGVQRYASMWTGDNTASWDHLALTMPMIMGLGLAGVPFAGFDIGGFIGSPSDELFTRFLQIGIFMPFCRTHTAIGTEPQEPWSYGPRFTAVNKALIRFRYRLLPQLYTAFYRYTQTGVPIIRPLFLSNQHDSSTYNINDQFMVGNHLMIAPVIEQGAEARTLYLPEGKWYRLFMDRQFNGGQKIKVKAPIFPVHAEEKSYWEEVLMGIPVFVRAGAVLPMQPVQPYIGAKDIRQKTLHTYTGGSATSRLYEDSGNGYAYKKGAYILTTFKTRDYQERFSIEISQQGSYTGAVNTFKFIVHGVSSKPKAVIVDGETVAFHYIESENQARFTASSEISKVNIKK